MYADKVLLNKVDLLGGASEVLEEIREVITKVNPNADITESTYAAVGLDFLLKKPDSSVTRDVEHDCHHDHCLTHSSKALKEIQSVYLIFEASRFVNVEAFE